LSLRDLCWLLGLVLLLTASTVVARALRRAPDWQERLWRSHATVYARLWDLAFWSMHHLHRAISSPGQRCRHLERSLLAAGLLAMVALTPVLALSRLANPDFTRHGLAIGIGGLVWSAVVESPGMADRIRPLAADIDFTPPVVFAVIVLIADVSVCCLALSGVIEGEPAHSICIGASLVAAADIVSIGIGVVAAAVPRYPFLDPRERVGSGQPVAQADDHAG
jgi:hypothetical protein